MRLLLALTLALPLAAGCGDDDGGGGAPDSMTGDPPAPSLGTQIDRAGRPAISTALIDPFQLTNDSSGLKDTYNADSNKAGWAAAWQAEVTTNIAILDGLNPSGDGAGEDGCGDQPFFDETTKYATLSGVLAVDVLIVDSSASACGYLGVETGSTAAPCGGRTLTDDVVTTSYTVLSGAASPVEDGPTSDDASHSNTAFPFLAAPQQ